MAELITLGDASTGINLTSEQTEQLKGFYAPHTDRHGVVAHDRTGEINAKTLDLLRSAVLGNEAERKYHWNEFFKFAAGLMNSLAGSILTAGVVGPTIGLFALGKDPSPYAGHTAYLRDFVWGAIATALLIHLIGQVCIRMQRP